MSRPGIHCIETQYLVLMLIKIFLSQQDHTIQNQKCCQSDSMCILYTLISIESGHLVFMYTVFSIKGCGYVKYCIIFSTVNIEAHYQIQL